MLATALLLSCLIQTNVLQDNGGGSQDLCFMIEPHDYSVNLCNTQTGSSDEESVSVVFHCVAFKATSIRWTVGGNEQQPFSRGINGTRYSTLRHTITNDDESEITVECEARRPAEGQLQKINSIATISVKSNNNILCFFLVLHGIIIILL